MTVKAFQDPLWQRIQDIKLENLKKGLFFRQLMSEYGWKPFLANHALQEYKRFMYLCVVTRKNLKAPKLIDKVWRLHMRDKDEYYYRFCIVTLRHLVRHPSERSTDVRLIENQRYIASAYKYYFKEAMPSRIWNDYYHVYGFVKFLLVMGVITLLNYLGFLIDEYAIAWAIATTGVYITYCVRESDGDYNKDIDDIFDLE